MIFIAISAPQNIWSLSTAKIRITNCHCTCKMHIIIAMLLLNHLSFKTNENNMEHLTTFPVAVKRCI
jgi:hypothetical protein